MPVSRFDLFLRCREFDAALLDGRRLASVPCPNTVGDRRRNGDRVAASREPTVVVTHFAPSAGSVAERFKGSPLNACFVSELDERIRRWQPLAWLHGHVHDSFDYRLGDTRVVANPRGYAPQGKTENAAFDPALTIDVRV